jgi:hypothetical protein
MLAEHHDALRAGHEHIAGRGDPGRDGRSGEALAAGDTRVALPLGNGKAVSGDAGECRGAGGYRRWLPAILVRGRARAHPAQLPGASVGDGQRSGRLGLQRACGANGCPARASHDDLALGCSRGRVVADLIMAGLAVTMVFLSGKRRKIHPGEHACPGKNSPELHIPQEAIAHSSGSNRPGTPRDPGVPRPGRTACRASRGEDVPLTGLFLNLAAANTAAARRSGTSAPERAWPPPDYQPAGALLYLQIYHRVCRQNNSWQ